MYRNANSCNMTNLINVQANKIGLVQGNTINDINDIFVEKSQIKTASLHADTNKYEYNDNEINNTNVPGLRSIIDYIKTHQPKTQPSINYEENYYVKNVSNNLQHQTVQPSITYEENNYY